MSNEQKRKEDQLKQDAEYQRRCQMTKEELGRDAIDRSVNRLKKWEESQGNYKSDSELREYMTKIAHKADRTNTENDGRKPR